MTFAEHERRLDAPVVGPDGKPNGTQRSALAALAKGGNAGAAKTLALHPCPPVFRSLYRHFQSLALWRTATGMGPAPLTLHDVEAYERRFAVRFRPGFLDLLKRLDAIALSQVG